MRRVAGTPPHYLRYECRWSCGLSNLTTADAERIGDSLGTLMELSPTTLHAVSDWLLQTPAMSAMQQQHPWFRPFVERLAELLFTKVGCGMQSPANRGRGWGSGVLSVPCITHVCWLAAVSTGSGHGKGRIYVTLKQVSEVLSMGSA